ncbi:MAG TPA: anti-sigma factor, partial [Burkholderiaceae bacterium]|nr:anti-sigma factor [Burkholderiaceae bacterium]
MNTLPVTEADLHAYVDGLLPPSRRVDIEAYLAAHPKESGRVNAFRAQNAALHAQFDHVLDEPLPNRLRGSTGLQRRDWWQRIVAGLLIAVISGSGGWLLHTLPVADVPLTQNVAADNAADQRSISLAHEAAIAHVVYSPDVRHPVEIGADQEEQLVAWLTKRMGSDVHPPKLGKLGYELIGGRLLPGQRGPVAQFMYHDLAGQRLTLYVSTEQTHNKDTGFRFAQEGPVNVFYWIDGKFGYALSAGTDKGELARIATAVYEQLE